MGDAMIRSKGSFVRVLGKSVVEGYSKRDSDWPYSEAEDDAQVYMEFICRLDKKGREVALPCSPYGEGVFNSRLFSIRGPEQVLQQSRQILR